jgi:hypothetical protein
MYLQGMTVTHSGKRTSSRGKSRSVKVDSVETRPDAPRLIENFSIDEPRYLLGQVAFAADMSSDLLKAWITRKVVPMGEHDREAHGKGSARVFTLRRALSVALAAECVKLGMSASTAGFFATGGIDMTPKKSARDALQTNDLLSIYPRGPSGDATADAADWNWSIKKLLGPYSSSCVLVNVQAIAERVLRRLGELEQ